MVCSIRNCYTTQVRIVKGRSTMGLGGSSEPGPYPTQTMELFLCIDEKKVKNEDGEKEVKDRRRGERGSSSLLL